MRPRKVGMVPEAQSRAEIQKLYRNLEAAGIKPEPINEANPGN